MEKFYDSLVKKHKNVKVKKKLVKIKDYEISSRWTQRN